MIYRNFKLILKLKNNLDFLNMKKFTFFIYFTLISYIFSDTADLKASQSLNAGESVSFKITVTPDASTSVTVISGKLEDDSDSNKKVAFTCTAPGTITAATDVVCTAPLTDASTYKLSTDGWTFTATATADNSPVTISSPGAGTMVVIGSIVVDLKTSQTIKTGSNVELKLTVTPYGLAIKVTKIEGLELVLSTSASTKTTITCTIASATTVSKATATDFTCTAESISTEGTYKLGGTLALTATDSDNNALSGITPSVGETTLTVSDKTVSNTDDGDSKSDSKYLNVSLCLFLILFFF